MPGTSADLAVDESEVKTEEVPAAAVVEQVADVPATPVEEVKTGVSDFEAALAFVESGVAQLGDAAKDELKELAKKYL